MKKYAIAASLFLLNNEVVSWLALLIIVAIAVSSFAKAVDEEVNER